MEMGPVFCIWPDAGRTQSDPLCDAWENQGLDAFCVWNPPPHPVAWVTFMPTSCSLLRGTADCSVPYKVSSFVVCKAFSSCLTRYPKAFLLSQNYCTSAQEEHQGLAKGMDILEEISWQFARHWWNCYTLGILESNFLNEIESGFSFPFFLRSFFFPAFLSFCVFIYSYKT